MAEALCHCLTLLVGILMATRWTTIANEESFYHIAERLSPRTKNKRPLEMVIQMVMSKGEEEYH